MNTLNVVLLNALLDMGVDPDTAIEEASKSPTEQD